MPIVLEIARAHLALWAESIHPRLAADARRLLARYPAAPFDFTPDQLSLRRPGEEAPLFVLPRKPAPSERPWLPLAAAPSPGPAAEVLRALLVLARWHGGDAVRVRTDEPPSAWEKAAGEVSAAFGYPVSTAFVLELTEAVSSR